MTGFWKNIMHKVAEHSDSTYPSIADESGKNYISFNEKATIECGRPFYTVRIGEAGRANLTAEMVSRFLDEHGFDDTKFQ